jgi:hypothetical protein
MTTFNRDAEQGGLPRLGYGMSNLWVVEIESFPPIYKVFVSNGQIAHEVFKDFNSSKTMKELLERYRVLSTSLEKIPTSFFQVPVNLISICRITTANKAYYKAQTEKLLKISVNTIPNLQIRWPANFNLETKEFAFPNARIGVFQGKEGFLVADLEDINSAHSENLSVLEVD